MEPGIIHLIGETHTDSQDISQKNLLETLANEGKLILGLEGKSQEVGQEIDSPIFGLEDRLIYDLSTALDNIIYLVFHATFKRAVAIDCVPDFYTRDNYSDTFANNDHRLSLALSTISHYLSDVFEKEDLEEIQFISSEIAYNKVLINYKEARDKEKRGMLKFEESMFKYLGSNQFDDNFYDNLSNGKLMDWNVLFNRHIDYLLKKHEVDAKTREDISAALDIMNGSFIQLKHFTNDPNDHFNLEEIFERLVDVKEGVSNNLQSHSRNQSFLDNIKKQFSKKRDLNKPFFVIVGADHVPYLKEQLSAQGIPVFVNDETYDYSEKSEL